MAFRRVRKQLLCPRCGDVVAEVVHRPWPVLLRLTAADGSPVVPVGGAVLLRAVEQQAAAAAPGDRAEPQAVADFVRRHLGELMVELTCRRGHRTVQTVPALVRAVRRTPGQWVAVR